MGKGGGKNNAQEGRSESGNGLKKEKRKSGQCLPKASVIPELIIKSKGLDAHIQYMKDHALIAKCVGIWPQEKYLVGWIDMTWKPKWGYDLRLEEKGFFIIIFYNIGNKNHVFEGGPYF